MERINNVLFCDKCLLQFDKKIVFDIHLSFVHKISIKVESEEKTIEIKNEDTDSACQTDSKKPNQDIINPFVKGNKPHKCKMCNYTTSQKGQLNHHIKSTHEEKKLHKCSICDYSFSKKESLKRHIESVHEKKKPHKCSICNKSFARKFELKTHTVIVHEKKKPYMCLFCDFKCSKKGNLKQHMWIKHDEPWTS